VLEGAASRQEALEQIKQNTRHFAKRQGTWFRSVEEIHWLDMEQADAASKAIDFARAFWEGNA
jgi:tRNA dimethylallyltransferase